MKGNVKIGNLEVTMMNGNEFKMNDLEIDYEYTTEEILELMKSVLDYTKEAMVAEFNGNIL